MRSALVCIALLVLASGPMACSLRRARALEGRVSALNERVTKLQDQLEDVRDSLDDARSELDDLNGAVDDLASAAGDFGSRDWKSVAEDVQAAAGDVESGTASLETALDEAISAAEGEASEDLPTSNVSWAPRARRSVPRPEMMRGDARRREPHALRAIPRGSGRVSRAAARLAEAP